VTVLPAAEVFQVCVVLSEGGEKRGEERSLRIRESLRRREAHES